jgi:uncharacterized protein YceH (UPF0502 family)
MSDTAPPADAPAPGPAPFAVGPLEPFERRVLGTLAEKSQTSKSPDAYPMTLNSIVLGCNQKSNRDPVYDLTDDDVELALDALGDKGLTMKLLSSRADRWRHQMYDKWSVSKAEMAILAELMLRGPQQLGDLRGRASRMTDIPDLDTLKGHLTHLAARGLVVLLTPLDKRGAAVTHAFHSPDELDRARALLAGGASEVEAPPPARAAAPANAAALEARLDEAFAEIARLQEAVARLESKLATG